MFIRKKLNKSGSTSVLVLEFRDRRQRIIKNFGFGRTAAEIAGLVSLAQKYISDAQGPSLPNLFPEEDTVKSFVASLANSQVQVIGPELIFGTLYDRIGYGVIQSELFRHLVICRLFNPGSKLKTIDYLDRYLHVHYAVDKIYRFLDLLSTKEQDGGIKELVEQITFAHTKKVVGGKIMMCFYDMTTLYFEAADEDELRCYGFSKDGKNACPQIFLGLLVAAEGNPIGYDIFKGNTSESKTLIPMIKSLSRKYDLGKPVIIADAGLLTKRNIADLETDGYEYILGARPKNTSAATQEQILSLHMKDGDIAEIKQPGMRLIVSQSSKRAKKDHHNRERGLKRLQNKLKSGKLTKQHINNRGYNKYLKMSGSIDVSIDMDKFNADAAWDGIKGYVTNTKLAGNEVIEHYSNLWCIERAFRLNKGDLRVRPMFHRLRNRIEGHICICFTAYTVLLEFQRMLKAAGSTLSVKQAQEETKTMYAINYELPESKIPHRQILGMNEAQQEIYDIIFRPAAKF